MILIPKGKMVIFCLVIRGVSWKIFQESLFRCVSISSTGPVTHSLSNMHLASHVYKTLPKVYLNLLNPYKTLLNLPNPYKTLPKVYLNLLNPYKTLLNLPNPNNTLPKVYLNLLNPYKTLLNLQNYYKILSKVYLKLLNPY